MPTAEKILELARAEIGEREYPPASNNVKYNSAYYGRDVSGSQYSWCAVFVWWVFRQAGASNLFYGGNKTAYVPALMQYHKASIVTEGYKPGDIVFFDFDGNHIANHVGIVESYDGAYLTSIDGNTGVGSEANGGAVMRRTRYKSYVMGAYRPKYEVDHMTQERWDEMMEDWLARKAQEKPSDWAVPHIQNAIDAGVMSENAAGSIDRPRSFATREELATVAAQIVKK